MKNKLLMLGFLVAATVVLMAAVVVKISQFPQVTTPGTNDLFLLASATTNKNIKYSDLKAAINLTNIHGSWSSNTIAIWRGTNLLGYLTNGAEGYFLGISNGVPVFMSVTNLPQYLKLTGGTVIGPVTLQNSVTFDDIVTFGDTVDFSGAVTFDNQVDFTEPTFFGDTADFGADVTFEQDVVFQDSVEISQVGTNHLAGSDSNGKMTNIVVGAGLQLISGTLSASAAPRPISVFTLGSINLNGTAKVAAMNSTGASTWSAAIEVDLATPLGMSGTFSNLVYHVATPTTGVPFGVGTNFTVTLSTNGVPTSFSVTLTGDGVTTTTNSGTLSLTIPANTSCAWRLTNNVSTLAADHAFSCGFY